MISIGAVESQICDSCGQHRVSELAREIDPTVMGEDNSWIGGFSRDKSAKWGAALAEASRRLMTPCIKIMLDCEWSYVCKKCLLDWTNKFKKDEQ